MPSLVVGTTVTPILHRSQLAALLGLRAAEEGDAPALAWDCAAVLGGWVDALGEVPFPLLVAPTPSRGRSLRNLTVNVFHPFELLPVAHVEGRFDWDPDRDDERERLLADAPTVRAYAAARRDGWIAHLGEHGALEAPAAVATPRGPITWANLLAQQRWHAAYHYRQLVAVLDAQGAGPARRLDLDGLPGLDLPVDVF